MTIISKRPFQNMTTEGWQNLGLAALCLFYLLQIGFDVFWKNICGHLAIDYCAFWSAGQVAKTTGYTAVYDLNLLGEIQKAIFPKLTAVTPIPFLPIFIIPFQLFSLLDVSFSFWLWTFINLAILVFYLRFFSKRLTGKPVSSHLLLMMLLSLPTFINTFTGQVNVWLTICTGEFMRAMMTEKPLQAGLWLGGFLLKPQILVLIVPALLIKRAIKTLAGLATSSVVLIGASFVLIGINGFRDLLSLWLGYAGGLPTNDVGIMMNWRMIGLYLSALTSPSFGWPIAGIGILITAAAAILLWRHPVGTSSPLFAIIFLGTLAATGAVTWHSHVHMAMILIPPMIYLLEKNLLSNKILNHWVLLPACIYVLVIVLASLVQASVLSSDLDPLLNFLRGVVEFGLNLFLLFWTTKQTSKYRTNSLQNF